MKRLINKIYDIRDGEWKITFALFAISFLLISVVYFLKPTRDSLFLVGLGAEKLPYVFILIAVLAIPVTGLVIRAVQLYRSLRVFIWTIFLIIFQLLIIRLLLELQQNWVYVLFYLWVGIVAILVISQFWLLANEIFNTAQSKRIFPLLNLGAILGAIAGSNATSAMISFTRVSTENLLFASIAILLLISIISLGLRGRLRSTPLPRTPGKEKQPSALGGLKSIFQSRYQLIIAGIIGSGMLVSTLADYQLKAVAVISFPDKADLTSFMGIFYGNISLLALIIQIVLSGRILRKIGLGGALLTRPAGLFIGAVLMAVEPVLAFAVFLGGIDNATQYSIDKTGREILFLPFSQKLKERIKFFLDVIVDRFFKGFAGVILLILVAVLDFNIRQIAMVTIVFSFLWLLLSRLAQREYVQQFRNALMNQYIDIKPVSGFDLNEPQTVKIISEQLKSNDPNKVTRALQLLEGNAATPFADDLKKLLYHELYPVRLLALRLLSTVPDKNFSPDVLGLLQENDTELRLESINYICMFAEGDPDKILLDYLNSNSLLDKSSALGCISKYGDAQKQALIKDAMLEAIIVNKTRENNLARAQTAQVLSFLKGEKALKYLPVLLKDPSPAVQREAIKSMGIVGHPDFIPLLINNLPDKKMGSASREALASYDERYIGNIAEFLQVAGDNTLHFTNIIKTLSFMPYQASVNQLLELLPKEVDLQKRYIIIKALSKLRAANKHLKYNPIQVQEILEQELKQSYVFF
ncbi:MAG: HEAT repeat domain-containing protein, partial [Bacteroidales bacterium]|nr:HEAT repeat domain-containing protein [Bacteroidales bacterium]